MPDVVPFRGLVRYQAGVVDELADVLVSPYDALTDQVATAMRAQSRWNLIDPRRPGGKAKRCRPRTSRRREP